jgi:glycosyltransferase involved in cell wall biosynthesis
MSHAAGAAAGPMLSVLIPYRQRLPYLQRALLALVEQDLDPGRFEIVIGCLEQSDDLTRFLASLPRRFAIRCVMSEERWQVGRARNIALRQCEGEVIVLIDADMLLPTPMLSRVAARFATPGPARTLNGQMLDYNFTRSVEEVQLPSYEHYRERYLACAERGGLGVDERWTYRPRMPWSLCRTAFMAIPRACVETHGLYFDRDFHGWGAEDMEWGYRIARAGIPIEFDDELWAIHMPHRRDTRTDEAALDRNYDAFIAKWPDFEVEIVSIFGEDECNRRYDEFQAEWRAVLGDAATLSMLELNTGGERCLLLGALTDGAGNLVNCGAVPGFSSATEVRRLPLLGLRLPYGRGEVSTVYLLPSLRRASAQFQRLVRQAAEKVALSTLDVEG